MSKFNLLDRVFVEDGYDIKGPFKVVQKITIVDTSKTINKYGLAHCSDETSFINVYDEGQIFKFKDDKQMNKRIIELCEIRIKDIQKISKEKIKELKDQIEYLKE